MPDELVKKFDITQVPMSIKFGDKEYLDKVNIDSAQFYKLLKESDEMPMTGQVTPARFIEAIEKIPSDREILIITIASSASGTHQSANLAIEQLGAKNVTLYDSNGLCLGQSYMVYIAAKMAEEGKTVSEIVEVLDGYKNNKIRHLFSVDSLKYLVKGGRIKAHKAFIADVLNLKIILTVHDGLTKPITKVRSRKKIIPFFINKIKEEMDYEETKFIFIGHSQAIEFAQKLETELRQKIGYDKEIIISEVGPTIGTHSGPGVLSVFYVKKDGTDD